MWAKRSDVLPKTKVIFRYDQGIAAAILISSIKNLDKPVPTLAQRSPLYLEQKDHR